MIVARCAPFAAALTAGLALGWAVPALGDPGMGAPVVVERTVTVTTAATYHGHSARYLAYRLGQRTRQRDHANLRLRHARQTIRRQTLLAREQARDYADDYGIRSSAFLCIHRYEGSWTDPGAPFWGGVQMDYDFMATYGGPFLRAWGTADHWPPYIQVAVAEYARLSGRGYAPWPNTARACGLL